jgi:hypothetical protein
MMHHIFHWTVNVIKEKFMGLIAQSSLQFLKNLLLIRLVRFKDAWLSVLDVAVTKKHFHITLHRSILSLSFYYRSTMHTMLYKITCWYALFPSIVGKEKSLEIRVYYFLVIFEFTFFKFKLLVKLFYLFVYLCVHIIII